MHEHTLLATIKIGAVQLAALLITLADIQDWLKILSLILAITYGAWKWVTDAKDRKRKNDFYKNLSNGHDPAEPANPHGLDNSQI